MLGGEKVVRDVLATNEEFFQPTSGELAEP